MVVTDPVALGLAATYERPGSNLTGVTTLDPQQPSKQIALLKGVLPRIERIAILSDPTLPGSDERGWVIPLIVDKILKGNTPGDLPVEVATQYELIVNLKVTYAIGVTIPTVVLKRADRVIERPQGSGWSPEPTIVCACEG